MNSEMLSRRVCMQLVIGALLLVMGLSSLLMLASETPGAGASVAAKPPAPSADSRTPYGEMNLAWTEPGMIGLVGWAKDPDVNRPIDVVVAIDQGLYVRTAGVYNPFLPGKYAEKFRSYLVAIPVTPGPHTMCVAALNVGPGNPFRLLGCKVFDNVASADPQGNLDGLSLLPSGDRVRATGWGLDLDAGAPIAVDLFVDGAAAGRTAAAADRPDIGAAFPSAGSSHGFVADVAVTAGSRQVCAVGRNVGRGGDVFLGCRGIVVPSINPIGLIDTVSIGTNSISISGWAGDPDARSPINVVAFDHVLGSVDDPATAAAAANASRPDVAAATGLDPRAGYAMTIPVTTPGTHQVCVTAYNSGPGADQSIGCRTVVVADHRPIAAVDETVPLPSAVRVSGWSFDPDSSGSVSVRIAVDGAPTTVTANQSRPDVGAAIPGAGANRGFEATIGGLSPGRHSVCLTFVNMGATGPGVNGDRTPPCGAVIVGATALGTTGASGAPSPVGPASGALANVDRDAGVSAVLRDGSVVWFFGDSVGHNTDGSLKYFVGGTGAWAPAGSPTITRDAVTSSGAPYLLATPGDDFPSCNAARPNRVMWPLSAAMVPSGAADRVVVYLANMCLAPGGIDYELRGVSVAQWTYDPSAPPVNQPVQLTMLNQNMGLAKSWGTAAFYDSASGLVQVYQCDRPANPLDIGNFGPCRVGRVAPDQVADPSAYRFFNGASWAPGEGSAVPMTMPAGAMSTTRYPAASMTVVFDAPHGVYVMAYSPWPGFVDRAMVRISRSPQGPWTEPVEVMFPDCLNTVGGQTKACYAVTVQPAFSTSTQLGLGYYDQAVAADRVRGQYMVVRVPFSVALS